AIARYPHTFFSPNHTATTDIYTLSLHDALPISNRPRAPTVARTPLPSGAGASAPGARRSPRRVLARVLWRPDHPRPGRDLRQQRSEEHTSELQSQSNLVCRLLLEKKKQRRCAHV